MTKTPRPATEAGRDGLAALLAAPARAVLAVDFDGTLAPIVRHPADARPLPGVPAVLERLAAMLRLVAVVSGRAARDVAELGGFTAVPGLVIAGNYGMETLVAGRLQSPPPDPRLARARELVDELVTTAPAGVHVEDKGLSLVVHTRPAADPSAALRELEPSVRAIAAGTGLELLPGRMVLELRPGGMDKGRAVTALIGDDRPSAVCVAGDDIGDLPAFEVVIRLRRHGIPGLTVAAAGGEETPGELVDAADLVVGGPAGVLAFLGWLADRLQLS